MLSTRGHRTRTALLPVLSFAIALVSCSGDAAEHPTSRPAVGFPTDLEWLNTDGRSLTIAQLDGSIVLLHFWSAGCIDCLNTLADLERLQASFGDELQIVGVHVPRFPYEAESRAVRDAVLQHRIMHPVVSDPDSVTAARWSVESQPTVVVIDADGDVVGTWVGDGMADGLAPLIGELIEGADDDRDVGVATVTFEGAGDPETVLSFPAGVAVAPDGTRVFVADTGHHRIVEVLVPTGDVAMVYGSGVPELRDGADAAFHSPRGVDVSADGSTLYVADTGNHAVRAIDLTTGETTTLAGTGALGSWPPAGGPAIETALRSPWDVAESGAELLVTMAGSHQIWRIGDRAEPIAGSGVQGAADGSAATAELARPGGIAIDDERAWFADPESSTIRRIDLPTGEVTTVAGAAGTLFETGDTNGLRSEARFQFPLGVALLADGDLVVVDTYNSRLRRVDGDTGEVTDLAGAAAGWQDGPEPLFAQPVAVDADENWLYVADTGNHVIRLVDLESGEASTVVLKGVEAFAPQPDDADFAGTVVEMAPVAVGAGPGSVTIDISLPPDHKVNDEAPSSVSWRQEGGVAEMPDEPASLTGTTFPVSYPVSFVGGSGAVIADIDLFWCDVDAEQLCFIEQLRLIAPISVASSGDGDQGREVTLSHQITLPGGS